MSLKWPLRVAIPIALVGAVGHMAGKTVLFLIARSAPAALSEKRRAAVERVRVRLSTSRWLQFGLMLVSAATGLPPFYAITLAAGVLRVNLALFLSAGLVGRAIRFVGVVLLPDLFGMG